MIEPFGHVVDVRRHLSLVLLRPPATGHFGGKNAEENGQVEKGQLLLMMIKKNILKIAHSHLKAILNYHIMLALN